MRPQERDLFGEVIVTLSDIRLWLLAVPRIDPDGPRAAHYIRGYDVPGKIARAKLQGLFEQITTPRMLDAQSAQWWHRMCWA